MQRTALFALSLVLPVAIMTESTFAQERYRLPPKEVVNIIDADPEPSVGLSPDGNWMLLIERDAMPGIADVSRRMLRLGGIRIDPAANGRFSTGTNRSVSIRPRSGGKLTKIPLSLPENARVGGTSWSHDSQTFAITVVTDNGTQLWVASVDDPANPKMLTDRIALVVGGLTWMPDAKSILCRTVPKDRGEEPAPPRVPIGPSVQESAGNTSPTRTYQDLLQNAYDEQLFDHYAIGQLVIFHLDGKVDLLGKPGVYSSVSPAPDGKHLLVSSVQKPYSYILTYRSFPQHIEVWDITAAAKQSADAVVYKVADVPMAENIPIQGVRTGPRGVDWKSGTDATLVWTEALDGGDPRKKVDHRDRYMTITAPFKTKPKELLKVEHRAYGMSYFADPNIVTTTEFDRDRRWVRTLMHDLSQPDAEPRVLVDRSSRDRYGDPGSIVGKTDSTGHTVARQDGQWIYRSGAGASPKGNLPFLDRQDLTTLKTERLWRCEEGTSEGVVSVVESSANGKPVVITIREDRTTPPNFHLRNLEAETSEPLTDFKDPTPQIRGIKKQLVKYKRNDGVDLSATLYLPADYKEGTRLPLLVWAYPREFSDAKTAGQIAGSPWRFDRIRSISHLSLLTQGYAIMDAATMPVIGDPETMNDTFIEQIVASAQAAIDKAVEMGVADRNRVGVGGHSYGAFMTANLLAHCDLFKGGIARSGAYNRTLTPFGFQSERRAFWEAKEIYFSISPFMHANKIQDPILLIHGENDNNSGTFPLQSKRMYQAIKGNGGTVRLVMLPYESHGYRAKESVLHTQAEMIEWFDKYVKNPSTGSEVKKSVGTE